MYPRDKTHDIRPIDTEIIPLELSSAYRDRTVWPNPFRFDSVLNNTGQKMNGIAALDPITYQLPVNLGTIPELDNKPILLKWKGLDVQLTGTIISVAFEEITVSFTTTFETEHNYYRGLIGIVGDKYIHISEYIFLGSSVGLFRFTEPVSVAVGETLSVSFNSSSAAIAASCPTFPVFVPKTMPQNALAGYHLLNETLNSGAKILTFSSKRSEALVRVKTDQTQWTNNHTYSIRRELPFIAAIQDSTVSTVTVSSLSVGTGAPGDFLRNPVSGETVTVLDIDRATGTITFSPSVAVPWTGPVEILRFARDNYNFITYSSLQREAPTAEYEATLVSLSLPRERLDMDFSVEKIPFVYLEIRDSDNPNTNSFMSNNAGSRRALFKATPKSNKTDDKPFVKFSGDKAIKIFKFRPSASNFSFSILGPEGNTLALWINDTLSPYPPNRLLQCEVLLNIRKI